MQTMTSFKLKTNTSNLLKACLLAAVTLAGSTISANGSGAGH